MKRLFPEEIATEEKENIFNNPPPLVELCEQYYLDKENPQSRKLLTELIDKCIKNAEYCGDYEAQFLLGILYGSGFIMEKDLKKSFEWYEKSAKNGYIEAQLQVMNCYEIGEGVEKNRFKYLYWKEKIRNNNHRYERFHSWNDDELNYSLRTFNKKNGIDEDGGSEFILRTSEGDLFTREETLKKCPFFINYLKKEWKPTSTENGRYIIDMRSIEDHFPFKFAPCLGMYLNFLKITPNSELVCKLICVHNELWDDFLQLLNYFSNDDCILFNYYSDPTKKRIITELSESISLQKFTNYFSLSLKIEESHQIYIFKFTDGRIIAYDNHNTRRVAFQTFHDETVETITCLLPSKLLK